LIDLLKKTEVLHGRLNSFEDYKTLQEAIVDIENSGKISASEKLLLKQLKDFVAKEYLRYGRAWLDKKQQTEQESLNQKQKTEKKDFFELFPS
jgi:hypothetical protein